MASTGNLIGHYEVVARIAQTHTGEIFLARAHGEPAAIKVFKPEMLKKQFFELIERERGTAVAFSHPSAVKILDVTVTDKRPVIGMELAWGQPWSAVVKKALQDGFPLDREMVQWIGLQVALLLQEAHKTPWAMRETAGMLHGRIALNDIVITYSGQIKVPGFGIGRSCLTLPLSTAKLPYRAPELFGNRVDVRADIYGLGVSMHDAFTGKTMFKRTTADETRDAVLQNDVLPLASIGLEKDIASIIGRMAAGSPDMRPKITEIIAFLEKGLPSEEDMRVTLSERMIALFPQELKAHRRMRDTVFRDLPADPYLYQAVRMPSLPPMLPASALVELQSDPPMLSMSALKAIPDDDLELGSETSDLLGKFYEEMGKVTDPPATPSSKPSVSPTLHPTPPPAVPGGPTPTRPGMAAMKSGKPQARVAAPVRRVPGATGSGKPTGSGTTPLPTPPKPLSAELEAGDMIAGRYRVIGPLGEGGMALVFRVMHTLLEKEMAMKVLRPEVLEVPGVVERFEREARSSCRLDDPNIVRVTDFGRTEAGLPFLVMELISGKSLSAVIKDRGRLPAEEALSIIDAVLSGLEHAHHHEIVHRDMKPDNIMLTEKPGKKEKVVKIVDFGIAQVMSSQADQKLTQVGMIFGTPSYMAPEQATAEDMDLRTDLYAVGVILYEALSGQVPFRAETTVKLLTKLITQEPPPLVAPQVSDTLLARLDKVIRRALSKSKEDRHANAAEFRNALRMAAGRTR